MGFCSIQRSKAFFATNQNVLQNEIQSNTFLDNVTIEQYSSEVYFLSVPQPQDKNSLFASHGM